jgi:membrane protein
VFFGIATGAANGGITLTSTYTILRKALDDFLTDDGWAIASHIALSALMALFPFLIVLTAIAGFVGSRELADEAAALMLQTWPERVAQPIAAEVHSVLSTARGGALTVGAALALYFSSNGIESLRIALNRAYNVTETRAWYWLRIESIGYVLVAAVALLALAFLVVLGPLVLTTAGRYVTWITPQERFRTLVSYAIAVLALIVALVIVHKWLPAGERRMRDIAPGIVVTIVMSMISGKLFGEYLSYFANNYVTTYAGLASVMIALVFLYFIASIFIFGGEINGVIAEQRAAAADPETAPAREG